MHSDLHNFFLAILNIFLCVSLPVNKRSNESTQRKDNQTYQQHSILSQQTPLQ